MSGRIKPALVAKGILLLLWLACCVALNPAVAADSPSVPTWKAVTLDGRKIDSTSLLGKVVLVHFWATWCPPCREEMPALQAFYQLHHQDGLEVVAISLDDDRDQARTFTRSFGFPVAMMSDAEVDDFGRIWVLPLSFLIDRKGQLIKADWTGQEPIDAASLDKIVLPVLSAH